MIQQRPRRRGRPSKYVCDDRGEEIVGLRLHRATGRYYDTEPGGKRVYFGSHLGLAIGRHQQWKHAGQPGQPPRPAAPALPFLAPALGPAVPTITPRPAPSALPRKERLRLTQRAEILEAALSLFLTKDYSRVSMRKIAQAAGLATGTLYNFFDSKEALYGELVRGIANRVAGQIIAPLDGPGDELARIRAYIANHARILLENAAAVQVYFSRSRGLGATSDDPGGEIARVRALTLRRLTQTIQSGIDHGLFRRLDARVMAISLAAVLEAVAFYGILTGAPPCTEETTHQVTELFLQGVLPAQP